MANGLEGTEAWHWLRLTQKLSYQKVPSSNYTTSTIGQLKEKVDKETAFQEEDLLPKILDKPHQIKGPPRLQIPHWFFEGARSI